MPRFALICLAVALLVGCASPAARIRDNPALFASFPPEVQANVREGRVEVGYTRDMVFIALGRPDRVLNRRSEKGETLVWSYAGYEHTTHWKPVTTVRVVRGQGGQRYYVPHRTWVDVGSHTEYEAVRIEFVNDKVAAIETLQR